MARPPRRMDNLERRAVRQRRILDGWCRALGGLFKWPRWLDRLAASLVRWVGNWPPARELSMAYPTVMLGIGVAIGAAIGCELGKVGRSSVVTLTFIHDHNCSQVWEKIREFRDIAEANNKMTYWHQYGDMDVFLTDFARISRDPRLTRTLYIFVQDMLGYCHQPGFSNCRMEPVYYEELMDIAPSWYYRKEDLSRVGQFFRWLTHYPMFGTQVSFIEEPKQQYVGYMGRKYEVIGKHYTQIGHWFLESNNRIMLTDMGKFHGKNKCKIEEVLNFEHPAEKFPWPFREEKRRHRESVWNQIAQMIYHNGAISRTNPFLSNPEHNIIYRQKRSTLNRS